MPIVAKIGDYSLQCGQGLTRQPLYPRWLVDLS